MTIVLCLLFLSAADSAQSQVAAQTPLPKESEWAWIHTGPLFDKWDATTGKAMVTVEGNKFSATLSDSEHPTLIRFTLTGTVKGDQINVRVTTENSDVSAGNYSGRVVTRRFSGFADYTGTQTIILFDQSEHQLGLTRALRRQP